MQGWAYLIYFAFKFIVVRQVGFLRKLDNDSGGGGGSCKGVLGDF